MPQDALPVHDEERPARACAAVVDDVVGLDSLELDVAEVGEREPAELVREGAVRGDIVRADGQDLRVQLLKLRIVRPQGG